MWEEIKEFIYFSLWIVKNVHYKLQGILNNKNTTSNYQLKRTKGEKERGQVEEIKRK